MRQKQIFHAHVHDAARKRHVQQGVFSNVDCDKSDKTVIAEFVPSKQGKGHA